ncbi:restriction endonuclease subunit S [Xanthomonas sp. WHRI 7945]|nr:restriction endonuclease subunit S [Xanthomonas campestris pv. campestris]
MSLLDLANQDGRAWLRIGDSYGVTKKSRELDVRSHAAIPFIPMELIPQGGAYEPAFTLKSPDALTSGTYFERGDVLVSKITPSFENGKQAFVQSLPLPFGYATTEVIPLRPLASGKHDPRLLFFYLLHPDVRHFVAERMEGSTGRQRVPESVLLDLPMPDLDPQEQKQAADALELIQAAMSVEDKAAQSAQELKHASMTQLFARGLRGEAQKETEIGLMPESWDVVSFSTVREWLQYGTSVHCSTQQQRYPVLRIPNLEPGQVNANDLKYCNLSEAEAGKYLLQSGDLLFIRTNGVLERLGACAVYQGQPQKSLFASYLIRARLKSSVVPRFVAYFYASHIGTSQVAGRATPASDGKYNLNTGTIDSLPLPLPPTLDEQREIVTILDAIDRKIALHRQKRAVLEELFQSLLHKLMKGEIRVADLDLSALPITTPQVAEATA